MVPKPKALPVSTNPPEKVEVETELEVIAPPVRVRPWEEARPPPATESPEEAQVEVAVPEVTIVLVAISPDNERLPENSPVPCTERLLAGVVVPMPKAPTKVEAVLEVAVRNPTVNWVEEARENC